MLLSVRYVRRYGYGFWGLERYKNIIKKATTLLASKECYRSQENRRETKTKIIWFGLSIHDMRDTHDVILGKQVSIVVPPLKNNDQCNVCRAYH